MAKNNIVLNLLKRYQEREKMIVPEMYASFVLALNDVKMQTESGEILEFSEEDIKTVLELTQAFWEQALEKRTNIVKWAEEVVDIDLHTFNTGKAKAGGN